MVLELGTHMVNVKGFSKDNIHSVGTKATKVKLEDGSPIIIIEDNQIIYKGSGNSIMSVNQYCLMGIDVDDCPHHFIFDGLQD